MIDPSDIIDEALNESSRLLKEMKKTKDLDQRRVQSEIVMNLCRSAGVFFDFMSNTLMPDDLPDFLEDDED